MTASGERGLCSCAAGVKESIKDATVDFDSIKQAGGDCYNAARETTIVCNTTISKTADTINFGLEMKSALGAFNDGIDAKDFTTISGVVTSDKLRAALKTALEMDDLALACVNQSLKMIDSINAGVDSLPDVIERRIDQRMEDAKQNGSNDGDPEPRNLDTDCRELEQAVDSVVNMNPLKAKDTFQSAFNGIISKGNVCKDMFKSIHAFAKDVSDVSDAIRNFKLGQMFGKIHDLVKDIWRCLRLSDLIRSFAEAVGRLIKWIMKVIQTVKDKINVIDNAVMDKIHSIEEKIEDNIDSVDIDFANCGCKDLNMSNLKKLGQTIRQSFALTRT